MSKALERKLDAAGWKTGDAADFFGMTEEQRRILDARVAMAQAVRRQRQKKNLTQKALAELLHSTQPRVAKIESAAPDVSLDQIFKALVVLGGSITVHGPESVRSERRKSVKSTFTIKRSDSGMLVSKGKGKRVAGKRDRQWR